MSAPRHTDLPISALPPSARRLVDLLGYERAMRLVELFGGVQLKVPLGLGEGPIVEALRDALGPDGATRFMQVFGGELVYVPRCTQQLRDARDLAIQADYAQGLSAVELARQYHLTERRIWTVLKRDVAAARVDDSLSLFD